MVKKENNFRDAKVGDKVTCLKHGFGKILKIEKEDDHPIIIKLNNNEEYCYSYEGKYFKKDLNPVLFKGHVNFEIRTTPVLPDLKKGDIIETKENGETTLFYFLDFFGKDKLNVSAFKNKNQGFTINLNDYIKKVN